MDKHKGIELKPHVLERGELNAEEVEVGGQQRTPDNEMVLYVDDRSTLMHCKYLGNIQEITIVEITIGDDELNALRTCKSLINISLLHCDGFDNLCVLAKIPTLEVIYVYTRGPLRHIDSLSELPVLRKLTLSCDKIEEKDVLVLEEMTTLEYISLLCINEVIYERGPEYIRSTIITDDSICGLSKSQSIVKVNFEVCKNLTDVSPLAAIQTLELLNIKGCHNVWNVGPLGRLPGLKEFLARGTCVNNDAMRALGESRSLVMIDLGDCEGISNIRPVEGIETLEFIYLDGCTFVSAVGALGRLPKLKQVHMKQTCITDDALRVLSGSPSLETIQLSMGCRLRNVSLLLAMATLKEVVLDECPNIFGIGAFGMHPGLEKISVRRTPFSDDDLRGLCVSRSLCNIVLKWLHDLRDVSPLAKIKTLGNVVIDVCDKVSDVGALGEAPKLKELYVCHADVNDDGIRGLCASQSLVKVSIHSCKGLTNIAPLAAIQTLKEVNIAYCAALKDVSPLREVPRRIVINYKPY